MTNESLEDRLRLLGDHLDAERLQRNRAVQSSHEFEHLTNQRWRRSSQLLAAAALIAAALGAATFWPSQESNLITEAKGTVPATSTAPVPSSTATTVPVGTNPSVTGAECFDKFISFRQKRSGPLSDEWELEQFAEVRIPPSATNDGFIILYGPMKLIVCRENADGISFDDLGYPRNMGDEGADVRIVSMSAGWSTGASTGEGDFRILGRAADEVDALSVTLEDGQVFGGMINDGWFVIDSGPITTNGRNLSDELMWRGTPVVEWTYTDGRSATATVEAVNVNPPPKFESKPFPEGTIESLPIFSRDQNEADRQLPTWLSPFDDQPGDRPDPDVSTARRGAELDGIAVWVTQSTPRGLLCLYHHSSLASGGGCHPYNEEQPNAAFCTSWSDSIHGSYAFGFTPSIGLVGPEGAVVVDGTFIVKLSDGEVDFEDSDTVTALQNLGCA